MKQSLLVAVASAAIGAATATLLIDRTPPPARTAPAQRGIDVASLEIAFVRALARTGGPVGESREPAPTVAADKAPADHGIPIRHAAVPEILPPPKMEALMQVQSFDRHPEFRRAWMFRSMGSALNELGAPDRIFMDGSSERWLYDLEDGEDAVLVFHRGRLIDLLR